MATGTRHPESDGAPKGQAGRALINRLRASLPKPHELAFAAALTLSALEVVDAKHRACAVGIIIPMGDRFLGIAASAGEGPAIFPAFGDGKTISVTGSELAIPNKTNLGRKIRGETPVSGRLRSVWGVIIGRVRISSGDGVVFQNPNLDQIPSVNFHCAAIPAR